MAEQPPRKRPRAGDTAPGEALPRARRRVPGARPQNAPAEENASTQEPVAPTTPPAARRRTRRTALEPGTPPTQAPARPTQAVEAAPVGTRARARRGHGPDGEPHSNALGLLIERRFADATSPVRSYSELERRSDVSREALSRYVTARADRRRSPTIETLAAIADALRLSLEQVCRAAVAGAHGQPLPDAIEQRAREEVLMPLVGALSDSQFDALAELLRQMQQPGG